MPQVLVAADAFNDSNQETPEAKESESLILLAST